MKNHWINKRDKDTLVLFAKILSQFSKYGEGIHCLRQMNPSLTEEEAESIINTARKINEQNKTNTYKST